MVAQNYVSYIFRSIKILASWIFIAQFENDAKKTKGEEVKHIEMMVYKIEICPTTPQRVKELMNISTVCAYFQII